MQGILGTKCKDWAGAENYRAKRNHDVHYLPRAAAVDSRAVPGRQTLEDNITEPNSVPKRNLFCDSLSEQGQKREI